VRSLRQNRGALWQSCGEKMLRKGGVWWVVVRTFFVGGWVGGGE